LPDNHLDEGGFGQRQPVVEDQGCPHHVGHIPTGDGVVYNTNT
jgi:hypothetical protein